MDDYLFIVLAKLQADRLKLQREQQAERSRQREFTDESARPDASHSPRARRFNSGSKWSEPKLGEQS